MRPQLQPCASDRVVDAYSEARKEIEGMYPTLEPMQRQTTLAWEKVLHQKLSEAVDEAFIQGYRDSRRHAAKPAKRI